MGAVNGKNGYKPGYVEHFSDRMFERTQHDLAVHAAQPLARQHDHAQIGAADITELFKIDDDAPLTRFDASENLILKRLGGVGVSFPERLRVTTSAALCSVISI